jgi:biotin transporter BioY
MYLVEGVLIDLPFFSSGNHGWKSLLGPTGGYLEGFVLAAWVVVRPFLIAGTACMSQTLICW